jgi:hypothetical protein
MAEIHSEEASDQRFKSAVVLCEELCVLSSGRLVSQLRHHRMHPPADFVSSVPHSDAGFARSH